MTQITSCRIAWKSNLTGYKGSGEWFDISHEQMLKDRIGDSNSKHPDLHHWLEWK